MRKLRAVWVISRKFVQYFAYRLGYGTCPSWLDDVEASADFLTIFIKWRRGLRVRAAEACPREGPAIFVSNHSKNDDTWSLFELIYNVSEHRIKTYVMMRDDFFKGIPQFRLYDLNELTAMGGAIHISRERTGPAQLKPFIQVLLDRKTFVMYPNGTRTRTGLLFEYRDEFTAPGTVAFFLAQVARKHPDWRVPAVPVVRTYHPLRRGSTYVFGPPEYLPNGADRAAQRALDYRLVIAMGELVEVNGPQLVAGLLYLYALHNRREPIPLNTLVRAVRDAVGRLPERRYHDPDLDTALEAQVEGSVRFLVRSRLVRFRRGQVVLDRKAVLAEPPHERNYMRANPVKHLVNQILHLRDVTQALEASYLEHLRGLPARP